MVSILNSGGDAAAFHRNERLASALRPISDMGLACDFARTHFLGLIIAVLFLSLTPCMAHADGERSKITLTENQIDLYQRMLWFDQDSAKKDRAETLSWAPPILFFHDGLEAVDLFFDRFENAINDDNRVIARRDLQRPTLVFAGVPNVNRAFIDGHVPNTDVEDWKKIVNQPPMTCWYGRLDNDVNLTHGLVLYDTRLGNLGAQMCVASALLAISGFEGFDPNRDFSRIMRIRPGTTSGSSGAFVEFKETGIALLSVRLGGGLGNGGR